MYLSIRTPPRRCTQRQGSTARASSPRSSRLLARMRAAKWFNLPARARPENSFTYIAVRNKRGPARRRLVDLMKVILAQPRGFCAGVVRAIEIVERALEKYGPPVYVRHEIVHNKHVVESLKAKGARFVEDLSEIPPGAVTVFSAHGVAKSVEDDAAT